MNIQVQENANKDRRKREVSRTCHCLNFGPVIMVNVWSTLDTFIKNTTL